MTMASIMGSAAGLGVEAGASRREDTGLRRRDLLAGQGTVLGLEQQAEGETLAALSNLGATIFVVQFHAAQDSASCLPDYQHRVAGKRQFWHGNGEISDHRGEFGRRGVPRHAGSSHHGVEVELAQNHGADAQSLGPFGVKLTDPAGDGSVYVETEAPPWVKAGDRGLLSAHCRR